MIQFAREHFPDNKHPTLLFIEMAAEALQFFEDLISSSVVLHCTGWLITARCFQVLLAVCTPGGGS
jgi:hypothetical protein